MPAYLLDTNLLLYALDGRDTSKQARALELIERLGNGFTAALSAQNLAEFANVALKRLTPPLSPAEVTEQLELLEQTFVVYPLTAAVVREAVRGVEAYSLSYYDAQVWAVAKLNQVPVVLSEDFNVGTTLEGVLFLNPLESDFDLSEL
jgi:predicted nucleic acid-binding protein